MYDYMKTYNVFNSLNKVEIDELPLTQNERKLHDADAGPWGHIGLGFGVNFHKLLNKISGRTKKLKAIVDLDDRDKCINRLRRDYESIIFENDSLANKDILAKSLNESNKYLLKFIIF